jgi:SpoVK/Ycf46/Vps4 family AAA+-type ATPase
MTKSTAVKPCYSTLYEEWLIKYGQANVLTKEIRKEKSGGVALYGQTIVARLGLSGALQCAEMKSDDADVAAVRILLDRSILNIDKDAGALDSFAIVKTENSLFPINVDEEALDADAFFEMYPECVRDECDEGEDEDDDSFEDQGIRTVETRNIAVAPPQLPQNLPPQFKQYDVETPKVFAAQDQRPLVNPYSYSNQNIPAPPPSESRPANPYFPAPVPPALPPAKRHPSVGYSNRQIEQNSSAAWNDHRNQLNPFQTAREYEDSGVGCVDDRNEQHQYNGGQTRPPVEYHHQQHSNPYSTQRQPPRQPQRQSEPDEPVRPSNIPDSLKRKFQPPVKRSASDSKSGGTKKKPSTCGRPSSSDSATDDVELPEELKGLDKELIEKIQNEIMESGESITFDDIAGLEDAKQTVQELVCWPMKRPDLFTGLRRGPNGLLLFGPPGTGKTLIGKAIAHESGATFFSISSSSLTSKWIGEGEKLVRTLFAVAAYREPAVVFIDEIDSLLTQRKADENEASRRIKTEFLVQLDGTGTSGQGRVLVIGATNRPHELDDAARRRFVKRLYIPLPERSDREILLRTLLITNKNVLSDEQFTQLSNETSGFSGADLKALCVDAAMGPLRELGPKALDVDPSDVPAIAYKHFRRALRGTKASVAPDDLKVYLDWNATYGSKRANYGDESDGEDD